MKSMNRITCFFIILAVAPLGVFAQEEAPKFGITFSGFVKTDFFYDTRQTVTIREGHFLLFPADENLDSNGQDINAAPSFNFLSIQTRLTGTITAPDAFGAKVKGVIEADFFGNENAAFVDTNGFRLRHAYAQLSWKNTQLLFGQYWHPLFIPTCFSDVISFNTGAPIQPFSRNPQVRLVQKINRFTLIGTLTAQRDFSSPGGANVLRNAALPEVHLQAQFETKLGTAGNEFLAGVGGGYKRIKPLLHTETASGKFATDEALGGISLTAFAKLKTSSYTMKIQSVYGQNLFDLIMLGGYAVHELTDPATNRVSYTALRTISTWAEFITHGKTIQFGLWGGYTQNLGATATIAAYSDRIGGTLATVRGANIKSLLRISPRVVFISGKFNFAFETEYTSAAYAAQTESGALARDEFGVINQTRAIANLRLLFAAILRF